MDSLNLKGHNSFKNQNNRKVTHAFASRPLIFKFQQAVLKFNDICESTSKKSTFLYYKPSYFFN